jgi:gliding motility-associated-like protein
VPPGATHAPVSVTVNQLTAQYHLPFNVAFSQGNTFDASSFSPPVSFTLNGADLELDVADLNGDNKPEVVAEGTATRSYAFRNTHNGSTITTSSLVVDDTVLITEPRLLDINGDSKPDLLGAASIARNNTSTVSEIEFNNSVITANNLTGFADLNLDGRIDLAGTNGANASTHENQSRLGPFASGGFPTISSSMNLTKASTGGYTIAADFNNDGWPDIASTNPLSDNFTVWRNNGGPRLVLSLFSSLGTTTTMDVPQRLYAGDLDTDGKMDLVVVYGSTGTSGALVSVFHNQSTGSITFSRQDFTLSSLAGPATIGDLDGDGKPEIIVTHEAANTFTILKNISTPGTITATSFSASTHSLTLPRAVASGDINSDGKLDLIFTSAPNALLVLENLMPSAVITFTGQPSPVTTCAGNDASFSVAASGDNNFQYQWQVDNGGFVNLSNDAAYSGVNTSTLTVIAPAASLNGNVYRVLVGGDATAPRPSGTATLTIDPALCNTPPVITPDTLVALVEGEVNISLLSFLSDPENNLDLSTLRIVTQPSSGATAQIVDGSLVINYKGISFSGRDRVVIEICDQRASCTQEEIFIDVIGDIKVYNAVSPNGDDKNEYLRLEYIELFETTEKNRVSIFNRWGDRVYEAADYNNDNIRFDGRNKNGNDLPSGTYFYKIDFFGNPKRKTKTGYFSLKR